MPDMKRKRGMNSRRKTSKKKRQRRFEDENGREISEQKALRRIAAGLPVIVVGTAAAQKGVQTIASL